MKKLALFFFLIVAGTCLFAQDVPLGTVVGGGITLPDSQTDIPTHYDFLGKGGYRPVATLAERDAIKPSRLSDGMVVFVKEDSTYYQLSVDVWKKVKTSGIPEPDDDGKPYVRTRQTGENVGEWIESTAKIPIVRGIDYIGDNLNVYVDIVNGDNNNIKPFSQETALKDLNGVILWLNKVINISNSSVNRLYLNISEGNYSSSYVGVSNLFSPLKSVFSAGFDQLYIQPTGYTPGVKNENVILPRIYSDISGCLFGINGLKILPTNSAFDCIRSVYGARITITYCTLETLSSSSIILAYNQGNISISNSVFKPIRSAGINTIAQCYNNGSITLANNTIEGNTFINVATIHCYEEAVIALNANAITTTYTITGKKYLSTKGGLFVKSSSNSLESIPGSLPGQQCYSSDFTYPDLIESITNTGDGSKFLSNDGTYKVTGSGGSGTVTSVGLTLPGLFNVTGSPITTSGTLAATLASQPQSSVFAAPNGSAGTPAFRNLMEVDLPSISFSKLYNTPTTSYGYGITDVYTINQLSVGGGGGQVHFDNVTNKPTTLSGYGVENIDGYEQDPVWWSERNNYYTKANLQTSGSALVNWDNITNKPPVGIGTVTSVGLTLPSLFNVTGSPITTSGTLAATLANQNQATVFAAPAGSNGVPAFRTLATTDIPSLDWTTKITNKPISLAGYGITDAYTQTQTRTLVGDTAAVLRTLIKTSKPDLSGYVTLADAQTITGQKAFKNNLTSFTYAANSNRYFSISTNSSGGMLDLYNSSGTSVSRWQANSATGANLTLGINGELGFGDNLSVMNSGISALATSGLRLNSDVGVYGTGTTASALSNAGKLVVLNPTTNKIDPQYYDGGSGGLSSVSTTNSSTVTFSGLGTSASPLSATATVDLSNYYTKTNLQTSGQSQVHWGNLTNKVMAGANIPGLISLPNPLNSNVFLTGNGSWNTPYLIYGNSPSAGSSSVTCQDGYFINMTSQLDTDYANIKIYPNIISIERQEVQSTQQNTNFSYPIYIRQTPTEPDIPTDSWSFWVNTNTNAFYLILDAGGVQKKIQLQ